MRYRIGIQTVFMLALLSAGALVPGARADGRRVRDLGSDLLQLQTFNVSGEYSGSLGGEIIFGGARYQLASNVQPYEIGVGMLPAGTSVSNRWVFLSGVRTIGSDYITSVIVLPPTQPSLDRDDPSSRPKLRDRSDGE